MKSKNIDLLNVFLILISLVVAFKVPFELFLFSYAVLGPLHYLTEINWLKGRNYFVKERKWTWVFVVCSVLIAVPAILRLPAFKTTHTNSLVKAWLGSGYFLTNEAILISLIFAIGLVYLRKQLHILLYLIATIIVSSVILKFAPFSLILVGVFIPTIIHVYLFTLLFMIFGTLNNKSIAGVISIIFLILAPFIIIAANVDPANYLPSETTQKIFLESGFQNLSQSIAGSVGAMGEGQFFLLSEAGIRIQVFIAFCYTYHYLNWFSKTSIIGWGKNISRSKLLTILVIWLIAVFLYWYDYRTGFVALLFLSFFHVLLEFPLNVTSVKGIMGKLRTNGQVQPVPVSNVAPLKKRNSQRIRGNK